MLGPVQLSSLGVGAIIGTGIFVLTGVLRGTTVLTGPALMLSFVVSGMTCIFAALCYAEFASMAPVAGSAYTYAYATLGELFAWIIGWDLILEYAVASATVAHGLVPLLSGFSFLLPHRIAESFLERASFRLRSRCRGDLNFDGTWFDLLKPIAIAAVVTVILVKGIRESASVNTAIVILKLAIVFFVIGVGSFYVHPANWTPFAPFGLTGLSFFGHTVMGQTDPAGAPVGYAGWRSDRVLRLHRVRFNLDARRRGQQIPSRDVPIGIMTSLVLLPLFFASAVVGVLTGNGAVQSHQYRRPRLGCVQASGTAVGAIAGFPIGCNQ